ncbi:hypothetical protein ABKV19_017909 [Rosa sericea]
MLRRGSITISMLSDSTMLVGWCRPRRRIRRRRGSTIWLGSKRRRFCLGSRSVLQWGAMAGPIRMYNQKFRYKFDTTERITKLPSRKRWGNIGDYTVPTVG